MSNEITKARLIQTMIVVLLMLIGVSFPAAREMVDKDPWISMVVVIFYELFLIISGWIFGLWRFWWDFVKKKFKMRQSQEAYKKYIREHYSYFRFRGGQKDIEDTSKFKIDSLYIRLKARTTPGS